MPDSPTADQITTPTRRTKIIETATTLNPEYGHATEAENIASSVFSLLVETALLYSELTADDLTADDSDRWSTLMSLAENLATEDSTFSVKRIRVDHPDEARRAIIDQDVARAKRHILAWERQRAASLGEITTLLEPVDH